MKVIKTSIGIGIINVEAIQKLELYSGEKEHQLTSSKSDVDWPEGQASQNNDLNDKKEEEKH